MPSSHHSQDIKSFPEKLNEKSGQRPQYFDDEIAKIEGEISLVSIEEYRVVTGDYSSTDEQVIKKLEYLESLCRHIIQTQLGLQKHDNLL